MRTSKGSPSGQNQQPPRLFLLALCFFFFFFLQRFSFEILRSAKAQDLDAAEQKQESTFWFKCFKHGVQQCSVVFFLPNCHGWHGSWTNPQIPSIREENLTNRSKLPAAGIDTEKKPNHRCNWHWKWPLPEQSSQFLTGDVDYFEGLSCFWWSGSGRNDLHRAASRDCCSELVFPKSWPQWPG